MSNDDPDDLPPDPTSLDPETKAALEWQARLHSGEDEAGTRAAYQRWLAESPVHRIAAERAERLWRTLGPAMRKGRSNLPAVAISIGIGGLLGLVVLSEAFEPPKAYLADQRTAIGERRSIALSDGSTVDLNGGTSFDVDFGNRQRRLILYAGQIFVTARPDPARPFLVETEEGTAQALGTAFDVRRDATGTGVSVTEHRVRVAADGAQTIIGEGQAVAVTQDGLGPVEQVDPAAFSAWRQGRLVFKARPLAEVAAAIGRYRRGRIVLARGDLADLRVTGTFLANDSEKMLDALETALPIRILRLPWLTVIRADAGRRAPAR